MTDHTTPDPEVAAAAKIVTAVFDAINHVEDHERGALNLLINRASGFSAKLLQDEIAELQAEVKRLRVNDARYRVLERAWNEGQLTWTQGRDFPFTVPPDKQDGSWSRTMRLCHIAEALREQAKEDNHEHRPPLYDGL